MSKIGRKPIDIYDTQVNIEGQSVHYKGPKGSGTYVLPSFIKAHLDDKKLSLAISKDSSDNKRKIYRDWGLHRALLSNVIEGSTKGFEKQIKIIGLGYKAALSGNKIIFFSLGYSHKIEIPLPKEVSLEIDKSGQLLTFKSPNRLLLGDVCDKVRSLRLPEPYKGTGVRYVNEVVARKAGKTKAS